MCQCGTDEWVKHLDFIAHFDINHDAPLSQRARYNNMVHLRSTDSHKQAPPLCKITGKTEATRAPMSLQYVEGHGELFFH